MSAHPLKPSKPSRQYKRFSYPLDLTVSCEGTGGNIPLSVPDISVRGMFISTPATLAEGTVLKLTFRLIRSKVKIAARAEVRYCLPGVGLGIEFTDLSPEFRQAIELDLDTR